MVEQGDVVMVELSGTARPAAAFADAVWPPRTVYGPKYTCSINVRSRIA